MAQKFKWNGVSWPIKVDRDMWKRAKRSKVRTGSQGQQVDDKTERLIFPIFQLNLQLSLFPYLCCPKNQIDAAVAFVQRAING